jgi:hypothetical protein
MTITYYSSSYSTTTRTTKPHANMGRELLLVTKGQKLIAVVVNSTVLLKVLLKTRGVGTC